MDYNDNNSFFDRTKEMAKDKAKKEIRRKILLFLGPTGIILFIILIPLILIIVLASLGLIVDLGDGDYSVSYITNLNERYWWPIGGSEITIIGGKKFAVGDPTTTNITSYFGSSESGIHDSGHGAIDIAAGGTQYIIAAKDGVVVYPKSTSKIDYGVGSLSSSGYGNYVIIQHSDGNYTLYGHMKANTITVREGDNVKQGQVIGEMGSSGRSTGQHLHFEVRALGNSYSNIVNPLDYVSVDNPRPASKPPSTVTGDSNLQTICLTFKNYGYSDNAIAGILGNMKAESGFLPVNTNSIGCDGIVQWCFGRITNLKNTYGSEWSNLNNQIDYVIYELENSYTYVNKYLKESHSASDMAYKFCMNYEVPGESSCKSGKRQNYANELLPYVQNGCK